jgi:cation transport regulator ChaB
MVDTKSEIWPAFLGTHAADLFETALNRAWITYNHNNTINKQEARSSLSFTVIKYESKT